MSKQTLSSFANSTPYPALVRAVVRQLGGWEEAQQSMHDISSYGIDGGFHGFIYYKDTCPFWKRNRAEILKLAEDMARDLGAGGLLELVAGFNCLKPDVTPDEVAKAIYQGKGEMVDQIQNALAWFAGEEVSRWYADSQE